MKELFEKVLLFGQFPPGFTGFCIPYMRMMINYGKDVVKPPTGLSSIQKFKVRIFIYT